MILQASYSDCVVTCGTKLEPVEEYFIIVSCNLAARNEKQNFFVVLDWYPTNVHLPQVLFAQLPQLTQD